MSHFARIPKTIPGPVKKDAPNILLVNPWIHDFAAYDFWAKPVGLLTLASILRDLGCSVRYIDCLDRFHPMETRRNPRARNGRGPYRKTRIPPPGILADIKRRYCRYGIKPEWFASDLESLETPDLILVTSMMTYWYPGIIETTRMIRRRFPGIPVILGGTYATLCPDHAKRYCGADRIMTGPAEAEIPDLIAEYTGYAASPGFEPDNPDTYPYPAFDLQNQIAYVPILTSKGCPFSCVYCASRILHPKKMRRTPEHVVAEIRYWREKYGVLDFAFYDDALLVDAENHAAPMFEDIIRSGPDVRFHTPNAVHIRGIDEKMARLIFRAGFKTVRLGLETAGLEFEKRPDNKTTWAEFEFAVSCLREAGFKKEMVGAYLLAGLPGQSIADVESSIRSVTKCGITPIPAYYSPVPQTALWDKANRASRYDLDADPLYTNNAILPCLESFSWEIISKLKNLAA